MDLKVVVVQDEILVCPIIAFLRKFLATSAIQFLYDHGTGLGNSQIQHQSLVLSGHDHLVRRRIEHVITASSAHVHTVEAVREIEGHGACSVCQCIVGAAQVHVVDADCGPFADEVRRSRPVRCNTEHIQVPRIRIHIPYVSAGSCQNYREYV